MSVLQTIPLSKLKADKTINVRKTGGQKIEDLAASIRGNGLLQNLGVVPSGTGYSVVYGGRRLRALKLLAKEGALPETLAAGIPCQVLADTEAHEASLAENTIREAMHPLDQFKAFQELVDAGQDVAEVAARFGVTELVVRQRMRLARVSEKLLRAYGDGEMTLEQLQAFAVVDDHERQEQFWKSCSGNGYMSRPDLIRRELTTSEVSRRDPRVYLVGLPAYEAAGGAVRRDLFSDEVFILDVPLLDRLADAVLEEISGLLKAEGWAWVEVTQDRGKIWRLDHLTGADPGAVDAEAVEALEEKELAGTLTPAELLEINRVGDPVFTAEEKARSGVILCTCATGNGLEVHQAMLMPVAELANDSARAAAGPDAPGADSTPHTRPEPPPPPAKEPGDLSFKATQLLQAEANAILQPQIARAPYIALALLVARLASRSDVYSDRWAAGRPWVHIAGDAAGRMPGAVRQEVEAGPYGGMMDPLTAAWRDRLPKDAADLYGWALQQPQGVLLELLAYLVATDVEVVDGQPGMGGGIGWLMAETGLSVEETWKPTEAWLATLPKPVILALVEEAAGEKAAQALAGLKKADLPPRALPLFPAGWVPAVIRPAVPVAEEPNPRAVAPRGKEAAAGEAA